MNRKQVFTVGHAPTYDRGIRELGSKFKKLGRTKDYAGGFAVKSPDDAKRLINEFNKHNEWAIYEIEADWDTDTIPSTNGWWHALLKSSIVLRKIEQ
jgi:hypothetical protein